MFHYIGSCCENAGKTEEKLKHDNVHFLSI